jgi:hypothetical protein
MRRLWTAIEQTRDHTRILVTDGAGDTLLKARLEAIPRHDRALSTLLEALALWQGLPVSAALVADVSPSSFGSSPCLLVAGFEQCPLYTLELVGRRRRRRTLPARGLGRFDDLRRLLVDEVAR